MKKFEGILVPLVTPLRESGDIDRDCLQKLIRHTLANGADVIMPVAGTGEGTSLSHKQRRDVVEITVDEVQGKCPVVPGVIIPGLGDRIDATLEYKKIGVDGVMLLTPYYSDFAEQDDLVDYFLHFLDVTEMPLMIENLPTRTNNNMLPETYFKLAKKTHLFNSVKECIMNTAQFSDAIYQVGDRVSILSGLEGMFSTALVLGAKGGVLAAANLFPQIFKKMLEAVHKKDVDTVNKIHYELVRPLNAVLFAYPHPGPLRVALKHIGIDTGPSVLPVKEPPEVFQKKIIEVVDETQDKLANV
ncbi:MAG TPA: dihydrodipicolinate synthase family protein [Bacillota bacterium]|nr:dihydrodipicolinate synthase family protein [Bacillota bacterium]